MYFNIETCRREFSLMFGNILLLFITFIYFSYTQNLPYGVHASLGHDDLHFYLQSRSIIGLQWLGAYNELTLIKGMVYPLFLSLVHMLGVSISFAEAFLYYSAALYLFVVVNDSFKSRGFAVAILILTLFQPVLWPATLIRENFYTSMTLFTFVSFYQLVYPPNDQWLKKSITAGIIFGLFVATREEWVWAALPLLFCAILLLIFKKNNQFVILLKKYSLFLLAAMSVVLFIISMNYAYYQAPLKDEMFFSPYKRAYNSLFRVKAEKMPMIPINQQHRAMLYEISPAFTELKPILENSANHWLEPGCRANSLMCGDYGGGWFLWAFRDAAAKIGYFETYKKSSDYFNKISYEIDGYCNINPDMCYGFFESILKNYLNFTIFDLFASYKNAWSLLTYQQYDGSKYFLTSQPYDTAEEIFNYLGRPKYLHSQSSVFSIKGWIATNDIRPFVLSCINSADVIIQGGLRRDVLMIHSDYRNAFSFNLNYNENDIKNCHVKLFGEEKYLDIEALKNSSSDTLYISGSMLHVESSNVNVLDNGKFSRTLRIKNKLFEAYRLIYVSILFTCIILLISVLVKSRARYLLSKEIFIFVILLIVLNSRIVLLSYIDITNFKTISWSYLMPAFPFIGISLLFLLRGLLKTYSNR